MTLTLTLDFQGQISKQPYLKNRRVDWLGMKGMWMDHSWQCYESDLFFTSVGWVDVLDSDWVTSDFGMPPTHLVVGIANVDMKVI